MKYYVVLNFKTFRSFQFNKNKLKFYIQNKKNIFLIFSLFFVFLSINFCAGMVKVLLKSDNKTFFLSFWSLNYNFYFLCHYCKYYFGPSTSIQKRRLNQGRRQIRVDSGNCSLYLDPFHIGVKYS